LVFAPLCTVLIRTLQFDPTMRPPARLLYEVAEEIYRRVKGVDDSIIRDLNAKKLSSVGGANSSSFATTSTPATSELNVNLEGNVEKGEGEKEAKEESDKCVSGEEIHSLDILTKRLSNVNLQQNQHEQNEAEVSDENELTPDDKTVIQEMRQWKGADRFLNDKEQVLIKKLFGSVKFNFEEVILRACNSAAENCRGGFVTKQAEITHEVVSKAVFRSYKLRWAGTDAEHLVLFSFGKTTKTCGNSKCIYLRKNAKNVTNEKKEEKRRKKRR